MHAASFRYDQGTSLYHKLDGSFWKTFPLASARLKKWQFETDQKHDQMARSSGGGEHLCNVLVISQVVLLQHVLGRQLAPQHLHGHKELQDACLVVHCLLVAVDRGIGFRVSAFT